MQRVARDDLLRLEWWRTEKPFVRIDRCVCRVVNREQTNLIDKVDFFHRFAEAEAVHPVALLYPRAVHLDPFIGIRNVSFRGRDPVTDDTCSNHVGNKAIFAAIPRKQRWAGAAATVKLSNNVRRACAQIDLVLRNSGWP